MNSRCPACRREYTEEAVVWKPVTAEDSKRVQQQKRRKEKERKELESLGRKALLDVRIIQRNVIYVVGLGPRFAKEDTISVLRSSDYFGRYGKISRIQLHKRTPPGADAPIIGVYITYLRREDAERATHAIDGSPSPSGGGEVMRASYGSAKYCIGFLRNVPCTNINCLDVHEWGEPDDCFTREELATLKHTIKDTEKRSSTSVRQTGSAEAVTLPRTASWAARTVQPGSSTQTIQIGPPGPIMRSSRATRQPRNASITKQARNDSRDKDPREKDRRRGTTPSSVSNTPSSAPPQSSEAPQPAPPSEQVADTRPSEGVSLTRTSSPQTTNLAESEPSSAVVSPQLPHSQPSLMAPPGLAPPPGLFTAVKPGVSVSENVVPQKAEPAPSATEPVRLPPGLSLPLDQMSQASSRTYQLSRNAQALINDIVARREAVKSTPPPVFPDFDRTLSNLVESAGFSFSFVGIESSLPDVSPSSALRTARRTNFDPFAPLADRGSNSSSPAQRSIGGETRKALFDPFGNDLPALGEGGRSRFDFARRQNSLGATRDANSLSPALQAANPLRYGGSYGSGTLYNSGEGGRQQGYWPSYQSDIPTSSGQIHAPNNGIAQYSSSIPLNMPTQALFELPPTPFDQAPIPDNMRDLVRGFETPGMETANRQQDGGQIPGLLHSQSVQYQGPQHSGPLDPRTQVLPNSNPGSQRMPMKSPPIGMTSFSPFLPRQPSSGPQMSHAPIESPNSGTKESTPPSVSSPIPTLIEAFPAVQTSKAVPSEQTVHSSSPATQTVPSGTQEDFPALPSTDTPSIKPSQPTAPTKPPTAPPVARKVVAPPKAPKVEQKKPTLPPLSTSNMSKSSSLTDVNQSSTSEATPAKSDIKGKRSITENIATATSTPITPASANPTQTKGGKQGEPGLSKVATSKQKESKASTTATNVPPPPPPEPVEHAPILARQTKKSKPQQLPKKKLVPTREESLGPKESTPSVEATPPQIPAAAQVPTAAATTTNTANSTTQVQPSPIGLGTLLSQLQDRLDLHTLRFFNRSCLGSSEVAEYQPLVEALAALSASTQSLLYHDVPPTIDTAMATFQQLLVTLTQTISDLLSLLPRTHWHENPTFNDLQAMMKADLVDAGTSNKELRAAAEAAGSVGNEMVAEILEKKTQWMQAQLLKLEELHHTINQTSALEAIQAKDTRWDRRSLLPRSGSSTGGLRNRARESELAAMSISQLEEELQLAKRNVLSLSEELGDVMALNSKLLSEVS
ncbi:transcriptional repressor general negative regulator of transcription subunit 4 [Serendipita sp. 399]|nr:transcriptional repressor general negative regulator of transcription subunit 4 [Serendipita sp. 399]